MTAHSCPNCGAPITGKAALEIVTCEYCGSRIEPTALQIELIREQEKRRKAEEKAAKAEAAERKRRENARQVAEENERRAVAERSAQRRMQEAADDIRLKCNIQRWIGRLFFVIGVIFLNHTDVFPVGAGSIALFFGIGLRFSATKRNAEKKVSRLRLSQFYS